MIRRIVWFSISFLCATLAFVDPARSAPAEADSCSVFSYIDAQGNLIKTPRLESVPPAYRASMMTVHDCQKAQALAGQGGSQIQPAPASAGGSQPVESPVRSTQSGARTSFHPVAWLSGLPLTRAMALIGLLAASVAGWLGILVTACRTGLAWGLGCLFLPFLTLIFAFVHWDEVWPSFLFNLAGGAGLAAMLVWVTPLPGA